jgi:hypothetical protein
MAAADRQRERASPSHGSFLVSPLHIYLYLLYETRADYFLFYSVLIHFFSEELYTRDSRQSDPITASV